jgi:signal transduction histidine kinase
VRGVFRKLDRGQFVFDIVAPSVLFVLCAVPFSLVGLDWLFVLFGMCAALVFRRMAPGLALGIAWVTAIAQMALGSTPNPANLAILVVLAGTGAYGGSIVRWLGLASVPLGAIAITFYVAVLPWMIGDVDNNPWLPESPFLTTVRYAAIVFISVFVAFGLAWTVGQLMRTSVNARDSRRAAAEAEQEVAAEQERTRIARDMHDVVAHSLAVVVAQADGARYLGTKDPAATEQALVTIASTARDALADVRALLAQLRYSQANGPQPTLVDLDRLLEQLRAAGLTITKETSGEPLPLGTAQQLAVYRIVQESLTNALRHADIDHEAVLRFAWSPHGLELTVTSALADAKPKAPYGPGHGIAGMTERAVLVGGWLTAVPDDDRFVVRAWLPARAAREAPTGVTS